MKSPLDNGISVNFSFDGSELVNPNSTQFSFIEKGNLYYLNNVSNHSVVKTRSLKEWRQVLGNCNIKDVLNLENVVDGMKIVDKNNFTYNFHFALSGIRLSGIRFVTQLSGIRSDIMLVSGRIPDNCTFSCNKQL